MRAQATYESIGRYSPTKPVLSPKKLLAITDENTIINADLPDDNSEEPDYTK